MVRIGQKPSELERLLVLLSILKPIVILEIGTQFGGTLLSWNNILLLQNLAYLNYGGNVHKFWEEVKGGFLYNEIIEHDKDNMDSAKYSDNLNGEWAGIGVLTV